MVSSMRLPCVALMTALTLVCRVWCYCSLSNIHSTYTRWSVFCALHQQRVICVVDKEAVLVTVCLWNGVAFVVVCSFILFVYHCEFRDHIQLRTWILRYCILVGRENDVIYTFCCRLSLLCSIRSGVRLYELVQWPISRDTWFNEPWASNLLWQRYTPLLWAGSRVARQ